MTTQPQGSPGTCLQNQRSLCWNDGETWTQDETPSLRTRKAFKTYSPRPLPYIPMKNREESLTLNPTRWHDHKPRRDLQKWKTRSAGVFTLKADSVAPQPQPSRWFSRRQPEHQIYYSPGRSRVLAMRDFPQEQTYWRRERWWRGSKGKKETTREEIPFVSKGSWFVWKFRNAKG